MTEQVKSPDFVEYHRDILPALLEHGRGQLLAGQHLPVLGFSVVGTDESFSYSLGEQGLGIGRGLDNAAAALADAAVEGDQSSWWGKSAAGDSVLCRCLKAGTHPTFSGLYDDPRMRRLAALLPEGMIHLPPQEQDAITAIYKNPGVTEGLSDLPWHRDCGMGGHASMCPTYVLSIYLYDATPAAGQLQFLPGSQDFGFGFADASQVKYGMAVTVPACAGDITLHIGDVMHAAPPPEGNAAPFRQSILLAFQPDFIHHRGERHYNDALLGAEDGQVPHLRQMVKK